MFGVHEIESRNILFELNALIPVRIVPINHE